MRIVSMVPSWTETLIEAGADVVGRTRFCIHPKNAVKTVPAVGGTKHWSVDKIKALKPDVVLLDKEENTLEMGSETGLPILTTHVRSVHDAVSEMRRLSEELRLPKLQNFSGRLEAAMRKIKPKSPSELPQLDWIGKPDGEIEKVLYVIWKNPWMSVSRDTFIGSMLELFLDKRFLIDFSERYPKIELESFDKNSTLILLSSEPYPFGKEKNKIGELGRPSALVDGESWSWFGVRSLAFLESI